MAENKGKDGKLLDVAAKGERVSHCVFLMKQPDRDNADTRGIPLCA